jgi:hypothetical protein
MSNEISNNVFIRSLQLYPVRAVIGYTLILTVLIVGIAKVATHVMPPIKYHNIECTTKDFGVVRFDNVLADNKIGKNCKVVD